MWSGHKEASVTSVTGESVSWFQISAVSLFLVDCSSAVSLFLEDCGSAVSLCLEDCGSAMSPFLEDCGSTGFISGLVNWIASAFSLPPTPSSALPQFRLLFFLDLCREVTIDNFRALPTSSEHSGCVMMVSGVCWGLPIFRWARSHLLMWELQLSLSIRVGFHQLCYKWYLLVTFQWLPVIQAPIVLFQDRKMPSCLPCILLILVMNLWMSTWGLPVSSVLQLIISSSLLPLHSLGTLNVFYISLGIYNSFF